MIHDPFRMERLLELWEDGWGLFEIWLTIDEVARKQGKCLSYGVPGRTDDLTSDVLKRIPPVSNWRKFRESLSHLVLPEDGVLSPDSRFMSGCKKWKLLNVFDELTRDLRAWSVTSKRMFFLSTDLQILLGATSVGNLTWSDVQLPFDCFGMFLSEPILHRGSKFDCIIVRHSLQETIDGGLAPGISFNLCSQVLGDYKPLLSIEERERISRLMQKGEIKGSVNIVARAQKKIVEKYPFFTFGVANIRMGKVGVKIDPSMVMPPNAEDGVPLNYAEDIETMERVLRLVAGFCLYLQTLPSDSAYRKKVSSSIPSEVRGTSIVRGQHILNITTEHVLSEHERGVLRDFTNEVSEGQQNPLLKSHYRRGFYHRPRGKGDDPAYPKSEWTRPTIVRRDLGLPESGSQTTIRV